MKKILKPRPPGPLDLGDITDAILRQIARLEARQSVVPRLSVDEAKAAQALVKSLMIGIDALAHEANTLADLLTIAAGDWAKLEVVERYIDACARNLLGDIKAEKQCAAGLYRLNPTWNRDWSDRLDRLVQEAAQEYRDLRHDALHGS